MKYTIKDLVEKIMSVNSMAFATVAESIGYSAAKLEEKIQAGDDAETAALLFTKHPNSLKGMRSENN